MEQKHSNEKTQMTASEKFMNLRDKTLSISKKTQELSEKAGIGGLDSLIFNTRHRIKDTKTQNQRPLSKSSSRSSDEIER